MVKDAYDDYVNQIRHQWVLLWPGQCVRKQKKKRQKSYIKKIPEFILDSKHFTCLLDNRSHREPLR